MSLSYFYERIANLRTATSKDPNHRSGSWVLRHKRFSIVCAAKKRENKENGRSSVPRSPIRLCFPRGQRRFALFLFMPSASFRTVSQPSFGFIGFARSNDCVSFDPRWHNCGIFSRLCDDCGETLMGTVLPA